MKFEIIFTENKKKVFEKKGSDEPEKILEECNRILDKK